MSKLTHTIFNSYGEIVEPAAKPLAVGIYYLYDPVSDFWIKSAIGIAKEYKYIEYADLPSNIKAIALLIL